jgi:hypothetical protein
MAEPGCAQRHVVGEREHDSVDNLVDFVAEPREILEIPRHADDCCRPLRVERRESGDARGDVDVLVRH